MAQGKWMVMMLALGVLGAPRASQATLPTFGFRLTAPRGLSSAGVEGRRVAAEAYDVVTLNDGTVLVGKILRENDLGVVFRSADGTTRLIKYAEISDLQTTQAAGEASSSSAPSTTVAPASPAPAPASAQAPRALTPAKDDRRRRLLAERDGLLTRRSEISLLPSALSLLGGIGIGILALMLPNLDPIERTGYLIVGGVIFALGGLALIFKVAGRSGLDRKIRGLDRELRGLRQHGGLFIPTFELALVYRG